MGDSKDMQLSRGEDDTHTHTLSHASASPTHHGREVGCFGVYGVDYSIQTCSLPFASEITKEIIMCCETL